MQGLTPFLRCKIHCLLLPRSFVLCSTFSSPPFDIFMQRQASSACFFHSIVFFSRCKKLHSLRCENRKPTYKSQSRSSQKNDQPTSVLCRPFLLKARGEYNGAVCSEFTGAVLRSESRRHTTCWLQQAVSIIHSEQLFCGGSPLKDGWLQGAGGGGGVTGVHSSNGVLHPNKQGRGRGRFLSGVACHCPRAPPSSRPPQQRRGPHTSSDTCNVYTNTQRSCYN